MVAGSVARLKDMLGVPSVDSLLEAEPRLLDIDLVSEVLEELARLFPAHDPRDMLLGDPSIITKARVFWVLYSKAV